MQHTRGPTSLERNSTRGQNPHSNAPMLEGTPLISWFEGLGTLERTILEGTPSLDCNILKGTKPLKRNFFDEWLTFRDLWTKGKQSRLEDKDWETFSKQFVLRGRELLDLTSTT